MVNQTTIIVSRKTRDILKQVGHKGQSYDSIVSQLLTQSGRDRNVEKSNLAQDSSLSQTASSTVLVEGGP